MQLAARKRRLEQVGRIHRALRLARANQHMQFIDKQNHLAFGSGDFVEHGLQPFLELATKFRARDQRAHIERHQPLVAKAFRHVAIDDAQRKPFRNRGLADAGLADEHGIVLRAPRKHLDRAADFFVAPDHGIELAAARSFRQVAGIFLQRIVLVFGGRAVGAAALAQIVDRGVEILRGDAGVFQNARGIGALRHHKAQQHIFGSDEAIARLLR